MTLANLTDAEHAEREHTYLAEIADLVRAGNNPRIEAELDTVPHTNIPVLNFPAYDHTDHGFAVWAEWDGDSTTHPFNIVPFSCDHFPALPDGTTPGDAEAAAALIRAYVTEQVEPKVNAAS